MREQSTRKRIEAARDSFNAWVKSLEGVVFLAGLLWKAYNFSAMLLIFVLTASAVSLFAYGILIRYYSLIRKFLRQTALVFCAQLIRRLNRGLHKTHP